MFQTYIQMFPEAPGVSKDFNKLKSVSTSQYIKQNRCIVR